MRFNSVTYVVGMRGTGKTLYILGSKYSSKADDKNLNIVGKVEISLKSKKKVLIIDTLDHPSYRLIPFLKQSEFYKFNSGIFRIMCRPDDVVKLVKQINESPHMNNSHIAFEDIGKHMPSKLTKPWITLIADTKQRNIDIDLLGHSWKDAPIDLFRKGIDFIQCFKTSDSPEERAEYMPEYNKVIAAHNRVMKSRVNHYAENIDIRVY